MSNKAPQKIQAATPVVKPATPTETPAQEKLNEATGEQTTATSQVDTGAAVSNVVIDAAALEQSTTPATITQVVQGGQTSNVDNEGKPVPHTAANVEKTPEVTIAPLAPPVPHDNLELPLSASASARMTIRELKDYIAKMSAKTRMTPDVGGQVQNLLFHILVQAINTKAEEFEDVFGLTMKLIRANLDGCFSDANVHRYTPHITLNARDAATMRYLVNALTSLADPSPAVRTVAKRQINIYQALDARQIKEESRQRVLAYFNF